MAIQANELRIGNWVRQINLGSYTQVSLFMLGEIADDETYLDHIMPIPLNRKTTHCCKLSQSFTSDPQEPNPSEVYKYGNLEFHRHSYNDDKLYFYTYDTDVCLNYLHQLQNLIHSLTGKELDIDSNRLSLTFSIKKPSS